MSKEVKRYDPLAGLARNAKLRRMEMQCDPQWVLDLLAERDAMAEKARKFGFVEKAMEALACDEREGGIVTAASLILISSAHRMNAKRGVIDQEGVTFDDGQIGDWRVTIERIDAALQGDQK